MTQEGKLGRKAEQAIVALLQEPTLSAAAVRAGVSERTLLRWLKDEKFQSAYREAKREAVFHASGRLQQAASDAVGTLTEVMVDAENPAGSRVSAAKAVLDMAVRAIELEDMEDRLSALEAAADSSRVR